MSDGFYAACVRDQRARSVAQCMKVCGPSLMGISCFNIFYLRMESDKGGLDEELESVLQLS